MANTYHPSVHNQVLQIEQLVSALVDRDYWILSVFVQMPIAITVRAPDPELHRRVAAYRESLATVRQLEKQMLHHFRVALRLHDAIIAWALKDKHDFPPAEKQSFSDNAPVPANSSATNGSMQSENGHLSHETDIEYSMVEVNEIPS